MAYRGKDGRMYRNDGGWALLWGGWRDGAGRPATGKQTKKSAHSFWCTDEEFEFLKSCLAKFRERSSVDKAPSVK